MASKRKRKHYLGPDVDPEAKLPLRSLKRLEASSSAHAQTSPDTECVNSTGTYKRSMDEHSPGTEVASYDGVGFMENLGSHNELNRIQYDADVAGEDEVRNETVQALSDTDPGSGAGGSSQVVPAVCTASATHPALIQTHPSTERAASAQVAIVPSDPSSSPSRSSSSSASHGSSSASQQSTPSVSDEDMTDNEQDEGQHELHDEEQGEPMGNEGDGELAREEVPPEEDNGPNAEDGAQDGHNAHNDENACHGGGGNNHEESSHHVRAPPPTYGTPPLPQVQFEYSHPFMAGNFDDDYKTCAGSIIDHTHILSAAHCFSDEDARNPVSRVQVRVGATAQNSGGLVRRVVAVDRHLAYVEDGDRMFDLAVVTLATPLEFSDSVQPIALAEEAVPSYTQVVGGGWGVDETGALASSLLMYGMELRSRQLCAQQMQRSGQFTGDSAATMLCVFGETGSPCQGDSGAWLPAKDGQPARLIGVLHGGTVCELQKGAVLYVDILSEAVRPFLSKYTDMAGREAVKPIKILSDKEHRLAVLAAMGFGAPESSSSEE